MHVYAPLDCGIVEYPLAAADTGRERVKLLYWLNICGVHRGSKYEENARQRNNQPIFENINI